VTSEDKDTIPEDFRYTNEHEWVQTLRPDTVRIGVTHYAQEQLGDVVYVRLPTVGEPTVQGDSLGEVESTKSVSDVYSPVAGEVVAVNDTLEENPELINSDPYGKGWVVEIRLDDPDELDDLLAADDYRELLEQ
jgi:glycine cleavage system H protein